jgi:site-specific recombinase XerD
VQDEFTGALRSFRRYWSGSTRPCGFAEADHHHLSEFMGELFERGWKPSTVNQSYRSPQQLYRWLYKVEEEISRSPFDRLRPPQIPEHPVPVIPDRWLKALLVTCKTKSFADLRDAAIIRSLFDCGFRCRSVPASWWKTSTWTST